MSISYSPCDLMDARRGTDEDRIDQTQARRFDSALERHLIARVRHGGRNRSRGSRRINQPLIFFVRFGLGNRFHSDQALFVAAPRIGFGCVSSVIPNKRLIFSNLVASSESNSPAAEITS